MDSGMSEDWTSVWRAVKTETIDGVQKAIDQIQSRNCRTGPYVSFPGGHSETSPLYEAVLLNDAGKVRLLLHHDADIFSPHEGSCPREVAQELYEKNGNTHLDVLEILNEAHDAFEYQSKYGGEPRFY
jgi:hypothetical protein